MSHSKPQVPETEPTYDPSRPMPDIKLIYNNRIPTCPGKSIVALQVTMPPNGSTPPHTHAGAFVCGNVVSGYMLNKMNGDPMKIHGPGDAFFENPGCKHLISDNTSTTESATLIATMIVETEVVDKQGIQGLLVIEEKYVKMVMQAQQKS